MNKKTMLHLGIQLIAVIFNIFFVIIGKSIFNYLILGIVVSMFFASIIMYKLFGDIE